MENFAVSTFKMFQKFNNCNCQNFWKTRQSNSKLLNKMLFDFVSKLQNPNVVEKSNVVKKTLQKIVNSRNTCI